MAAEALPPLPASSTNGEDERWPAGRHQRVATEQESTSTLEPDKHNKKGGKKDECTLMAMAKMMLMMMQRIRDMNAIVLHTYIGGKNPVVKAGREAAQRYAAGVKRKVTEELHPYGAPHSHIWHEMA